jgi:hypothetical protein
MLAWCERLHALVLEDDLAAPRNRAATTLATAGCAAGRISAVLM